MQDESTIQNPPDPYDSIVKAASPSRKSANPYNDLIEKHAADNNIDPDLIRSVMGRESSDNPYAVSPKGARGLMQLVPATAARYGVNNIYDPDQNIGAGTRYLKFLSDKFNGDPDLTLAAYNAGEGAVAKHGNKIPPYKETQEYVPAVKGRYEKLTGRKLSSPYLNPADDPYTSIVSAASKPATSPEPSTPDPYDSIVSAAAVSMTPRQQAQAAIARASGQQRPTGPSQESSTPETRGLPQQGTMPGMVHLNPSIAPQVSNGAPRPFAPGEWVDNPDGSWSSEITVTVTNPALNGGKPTVIPGMWLVNGQPQRVSEDQATAYAKASGLNFPSFNSLAAADTFANNRESVWHGVKPQEASKIPPLWAPSQPEGSDFSQAIYDARTHLAVKAEDKANRELVDRIYGYGIYDSLTPDNRAQTVQNAKYEAQYRGTSQLVQKLIENAQQRAAQKQLAVRRAQANAAIARANQAAVTKQVTGQAASMVDALGRTITANQPPITLPQVGRPQASPTPSMTDVVAQTRAAMNPPVQPPLTGMGDVRMAEGREVQQPTNLAELAGRDAPVLKAILQAQQVSPDEANAIRTQIRGQLAQNIADPSKMSTADRAGLDAEVEQRTQSQIADTNEQRTQAWLAGARQSAIDPKAAVATLSAVMDQVPTGNPLRLLPDDARKWAESWTASVGADWLGKAAFLIRNGMPEIAVAHAFGAPDTAIYHAADFLRTTSNNIHDIAAVADKATNRSEGSQFALDIAKGFGGSAPELGLMALGVPAAVAFGLGGAAQAQNEYATLGQTIGAATKQAAIGALFDLPMSDKLAVLEGIRGNLIRAGIRMPAVGAGTFGIEKISGTPTPQALQSAAVNALLSGTGEAAGILKAGTKKAVEVGAKEIVRSPFAPESLREMSRQAGGFSQHQVIYETTPVEGEAPGALPGQQATGNAVSVYRNPVTGEYVTHDIDLNRVARYAQKYDPQFGTDLNGKRTTVVNVDGKPFVAPEDYSEMSKASAAALREKNENPNDWMRVYDQDGRPWLVEKSRVNFPTQMSEASPEEWSTYVEPLRGEPRPTEPQSEPDVKQIKGLTPLLPAKGQTRTVPRTAEELSAPERAQEARQAEENAPEPEDLNLKARKSALNALDGAVKAGNAESIRELSKMAAQRGASMEEIKAIVSQPEPNIKLAPGSEVRLPGSHGTIGEIVEMTDKMRGQLEGTDEKPEEFVAARAKDSQNVYFYPIVDFAPDALLKAPGKTSVQTISEPTPKQSQRTDLNKPELIRMGVDPWGVRHPDGTLEGFNNEREANERIAELNKPTSSEKPAPTGVIHQPESATSTTKAPPVEAAPSAKTSASSPKQVIEDAGYKYLGEQQRPRGKPALQQFNDGKHTLSLEPDEVTPEGIQAKVEASRAKRTVPETVSPALVEQAKQLPDWLREDIDRKASEADALGLSDDIERLAAGKLTAKQIAEKIAKERNLNVQDMKALVVAVRSKRGIPSMEEVPEFDAWLKSRAAAPPPEQPVTKTETGQEPVPENVQAKPSEEKVSPKVVAKPVQVPTTKTWSEARVGDVVKHDGQYQEVSGRGLREPKAKEVAARAGGTVIADPQNAKRFAVVKPTEYAPPSTQPVGEMIPFPAEMGSLGIPRAAMPQVDLGHRGAMVQYLKGRGVDWDNEDVAPDTLKPSQAEYNPAKVKRARNWVGPERRILISDDNRVLDGHHQWMRKLEDAPNDPIPVIRLHQDAQTLLMEMREFPSSFTDGTHHESEPSEEPITDAPGTVHKLSNTQVNLPSDIAKKMVAAGEKLIPNSEIYIDPDDPSFGREKQAHVTTKYGLWTANPDDVRPILEDEPPITLTLGKLSIFPAKEGSPYDVLKLDIESPDLHRLNKKITENAKTTQTQPDFVPHSTIAYLLPGEGKKYVGKELEGVTEQTITVNSVFFSGKNGDDAEIPLEGDEFAGTGLEEQLTEYPTKEMSDAALAEMGITLMKPEDVFPAPAEPISMTMWRNRKPGAPNPLAIDEAKARIEEWKAFAKRVGQEEDHSNEVILSLYDRTGQWSQPYEDAGYTVIRFDITKTQDDDLLEHFPIHVIQEVIEKGGKIIGVLAAPPCTSFTVSGAHSWAEQHDLPSEAMLEKKYGWWAPKHFDTPLEYAKALVHAAQAVVEFANPKLFHVLENPIGRMPEITGLPKKPTLAFDPNDYGDPYTKRTLLWGQFNPNLPSALVEPTEGTKMATKLTGFTPESKALRSETPEGFAYSFFMANNTSKLKSKPSTALATTEKLFVQIGNRRFPFSTPEEAAARWDRARDTAEVGSSEAPNPLIVKEDGTVVGHISYNGKVWENSGIGDWQDDRLVYGGPEPGEEPRFSDETFNGETPREASARAKRKGVQNVSSQRPEPRTKRDDERAEDVPVRGAQKTAQPQPDEDSQMAGISIQAERQPEATEAVAEGLSLAEIQRRLPIGYDEDSVRIVDGKIMATEKPEYGGRQMWVSLKKATATPIESEEIKTAEAWIRPTDEELRAAWQPTFDEGRWFQSDFAHSGEGADEENDPAFHDGVFDSTISEQRGRLDAIHHIDSVLASGIKPNTGRKLTEKQTKELQKEVMALRDTYEGMYEELSLPYGDAAAANARKLVERETKDAETVSENQGELSGERKVGRRGPEARGDDLHKERETGRQVKPGKESAQRPAETSVEAAPNAEEDLTANIKGWAERVALLAGRVERGEIAPENADALHGIYREGVRYLEQAKGSDSQKIQEFSHALGALAAALKIAHPQPTEAPVEEMVRPAKEEPQPRRSPKAKLNDKAFAIAQEQMLAQLADGEHYYPPQFKVPVGAVNVTVNTYNVARAIGAVSGSSVNKWRMPGTPITKPVLAEPAKPTLTEKQMKVHGRKPEKVNRAGFTKAQAASVAKQTEEYAHELLVKAYGEEESARLLKEWEGELPVHTLALSGESETVKVPDDGEFTISSAEQANRLHQKATGQPIQGFERAKNAGVSTGTPRGRDVSVTGTPKLDDLIAAYGGDEERTMDVLKRTLTQSLDADESNTPGHYAQKQMIAELQQRWDDKRDPNEVKAPFVKQVNALITSQPGYEALRDDVTSHWARGGYDAENRADRKMAAETFPPEHILTYDASNAKGVVAERIGKAQEKIWNDTEVPRDWSRDKGIDWFRIEAEAKEGTGKFTAEEPSPRDQRVIENDADTLEEFARDNGGTVYLENAEKALDWNMSRTMSAMLQLEMDNRARALPGNQFILRDSTSSEPFAPVAEPVKEVAPTTPGSRPPTTEREPMNRGNEESPRPLNDVPETITQRLRGGLQRSATIGNVVDTKTGDVLRLTLQPDTSESGTYSVNMKNAEGRTQSVRMKYKGGDRIGEVMGHFEHYMNTDSPGRFRVDLEPAKTEVPKPTADQNDKAELKRLERLRFKTRGNEIQIERLKARIAADPSKWKVGDGVGWKVANQTNRGFRIVEVRPETKQAVIRSVADTGLTTSGGDYDQINDQLVHISDLVRDNKYNASEEADKGTALYAADASKNIPLFDGGVPEFSVEGNLIVLENRAAAELLALAMKEQPGAISGMFVEHSERTETFRRLHAGLLAIKYQPLLAPANRMAQMLVDILNEHRSVRIAIPSRIPHETAHQISYDASMERPVEERHSPEGVKMLTSLPEWEAMLPSLQLRYRNYSPPRLIEEAFAMLAGGQYESLGLSLNGALRWTKAWAKSFAENSSDATLKYFKETSDESRIREDAVADLGRSTAVRSGVSGGQGRGRRETRGDIEPASELELHDEPSDNRPSTGSEREGDDEGIYSRDKSTADRWTLPRAEGRNSVALEQTQGVADERARQDEDTGADRSVAGLPGERQADRGVQQGQRLGVSGQEPETRREADTRSDGKALPMQPTPVDARTDIAGGRAPRDEFGNRIPAAEGGGGTRREHEPLPERSGDITDQGERALASQAGTVRQTDTPEFKRWFGDSKVVDENGEALIVYHGTPHGEFDTFGPHLREGNAPYNLSDLGYFFTPDKYAAEWYVGNAVDSGIGSIEQKHIFPVYLALHNPKAYNSYEDVVAATNEAGTAENLRDQLQDQGYDGLIFPEETYFGNQSQAFLRPFQSHFADVHAKGGGFSEVVVAFEPNQIKDATGRNTRFDPSNPNILMSRETPEPQFSREEEPWTEIRRLAEDLQRPEGEKPRRLPQTFEAAQMEKGTNLFYPPTSIPSGIDLAKQIITNKGVDGAAEFVLSGDPGIEWAATGYEVLAKMREQEKGQRIVNPAEADRIADRRLQFLNDFVARSTKLGQAISGVNAIAEYAPDRAAYILNKLSMKARGRGISQEEEATINDLAEKLATETDRNKALEDQIQRRIELARSLEEDLAAAEVRARRRENYQPGEERERPKRPLQNYEVALDDQAESLKDSLMAKIGNFNFGNLKIEARFPDQPGKVGFNISVLPGDAEPLAQYAASLFSKFHTVAELNEHMLSTFGPELEPVLTAIRQRAFQIRKNARAAELAARDTGSVRRRTILSEIQSEISAAKKTVRDLENAHVRAEKERKQAEEAAQRESQATARKAQSAEKTANERIFRQQDREAASKARKEERAHRLEEIKEARRQAAETKKEYAEASKAETKGWRGTLGEQREAARTAALWDTPLRNEATAAQERLANSTNPNDPQVMDDLVSVAAVKFLREKPGGTVGTRAIYPTQFYKEMAEEFPGLVNGKNRGKILKRARLRIDDMTAAARMAAKMGAATKESRKVWEKAGVDIDTQALLIQKATTTRQMQEARRRMQAEFERVSRGWVKRSLIAVKNVVRSLQTSLNMHQGRQGMFALMTHPIAVTGKVGIPQTLKGMTTWKRENFIQATEDLKSHRHFPLFKIAGGDVAEMPDAGGEKLLTVEEDQLQSPLAMRIPHVRLSTQGFILGMNSERLALFSLWATLGEANGYTWENNPKFFQQVAQIANDASGRSTMPRAMKNIMGVMNELFYATRLNYSRLALLNDLFNPFRYLPPTLNPFDPGFHGGGGGRGGPPPTGTMPEGPVPPPPEPPGRFSSYDPVTRRIMFGNLLRIAAAMAVLLLTARLLGFKFYTDPDDPDTWKLVWRNHHTDLSGGAATELKFIYRFVRSIAREIHHEKLQENEKPLAIAWRFYRTKAAPWPTAIIDWLEGKNVIGEPANLKIDIHHPATTMKENILLRMLMPISIEETTQAFVQDGWVGGTPAMALQFLGFETQTYDRKQKATYSPAQKLLHERSSFGGFDDEEPEDKERRLLVRKLEDDIRAGKSVKTEVDEGIKTGKLKPDDRKLIDRNSQLTVEQLQFKRADVKDALAAFEIMSPEERKATKQILIDKGPSIQKMRVTEQKDAYAKFKTLTGEAARMHTMKRGPSYYKIASPSPTP